MVVGSSMSPLLAGLAAACPAKSGGQQHPLTIRTFFLGRAGIRSLRRDVSQLVWVPLPGAAGPCVYSLKEPRRHGPAPERTIVTPPAAASTGADDQTGPVPLPGKLPVPVRRAVRGLLRPVPRRRSGSPDGGAADALPVQRLRGAGRRLPAAHLAPGDPAGCPGPGSGHAVAAAGHHFHDARRPAGHRGDRGVQGPFPARRRTRSPPRNEPLPAGRPPLVLP